MRVLPALAVTAAVATLTALAAPATGTVIGKENFHDEFTSDPYDCDGILAQDHVVADVVLTVVQRGSNGQHPFPYYGEHVNATGTTTNLETGLTYTNISSSNTHDHTITDNGDGTITILVHGAGGTRYYDSTGKLVLKDPGTVWFAFDVDYNGTPGNPEDDIEIPDTFRIVRPSTGNSDLSDRDYCEDLATFTSAP